MGEQMTTTKKKSTEVRFPDTRYMGNKERAESDAAYLKSIGYKYVKIVKHGSGYRVEASSVKEK